MQRTHSDDGGDLPPVDLEDERLKAKLSLVANVAAFAVIVTLLRVGSSLYHYVLVPRLHTPPVRPVIL